MTRILKKCLPSILLGICMLIAVSILPQQLIMAQTLESILEQRNKSKMNPQITLIDYLGGIAVNSDKNKIYLSNFQSGTVSVIDSNSGNITNIPVGTNPGYIAVDLEKNKIYVINGDVVNRDGNYTVSVINGFNNKELTKIPIGKYPERLSVHPLYAKNEIYVSYSNTYRVSVIDTREDKVVKNMSADEGLLNIPRNIPVNKYNNLNEDKIYLANPANNTISVIAYNGITYQKEWHIYVGKGAKDRAVDLNMGNIGVNPYTNKIYLANPANNTISVIAYNGITYQKERDIPIEKKLWNIAVNPETNRIYVINPDDNSVSVINGITYQKERDIPVGEHPTMIAVNPETRMYYVMNSKSVSVINGFNDKIAAGITFNVSPGNSGTILCNNKEYPTNTYLYVDSGIKCVATPNKDFEFSSWVENLGHNSSITLNTSSISDSPLNPILRLVNIKPNDTSATFVVDRYGSFTANFRQSPPAIPTEYWIPLYGIIVTSIVGWSIPTIIASVKANRQGSRSNQYYKKISLLYSDGKLDENDISDLDRLKTDITSASMKGKISEQHSVNLKNEISVLYEKIYKKKIESSNSNLTSLDNLKNDINDAFAEGKLSEQHYKLLIKKVSDNKNNHGSVNKLQSS